MDSHPDGRHFQDVARRPPERIDKFMDVLYEYWTSNPDLRFGQLVRNLRLDEYNREDGDALALIENQIEWGKSSQSRDA